MLRWIETEFWIARFFDGDEEILVPGTVTEDADLVLSPTSVKGILELLASLFRLLTLIHINVKLNRRLVRQDQINMPNK